MKTIFRYVNRVNVGVKVALFIMVIAYTFIYIQFQQ